MMSIFAPFRSAIMGLAAAALFWPVMVQAQVTAFKQAVAEAAAQDEDVAAFYRSRLFAGLWVGEDAAAQERRNALLTALSIAPRSAGADGGPECRADAS